MTMKGAAKLIYTDVGQIPLQFSGNAPTLQWHPKTLLSLENKAQENLDFLKEAQSTSFSSITCIFPFFKNLSIKIYFELRPSGLV